MKELMMANLRGQDFQRQAAQYRLERLARGSQRIRRLPLMTILLGLIRR
jgi:hypothetical protein